MFLSHRGPWQRARQYQEVAAEVVQVPRGDVVSPVSNGGTNGEKHGETRVDNGGIMVNDAINHNGLPMVNGEIMVIMTIMNGEYLMVM